MIERDSTVLPEPDSPTMPSVRPALERQRDAVDGSDRAAIRLEVRDEVGHLEQEVGAWRVRRPRL